MIRNQDDLITRLHELDEPGTLEVVRARLRAGEDPLQLMEACQEGVRQVGLLYEERRYFVSGLIMAGEILRQVLELIEPSLEREPTRETGGTVLLGTVHGDIHDIGKNIVHMLLRGSGFTVIDLGVDVPPESFVREVMRSKPAVVGLSGLLTVAFEAMRDTIALLRAELPNPPPVLIGGGMVDEKVCRFAGADHWAPDAASGLRLCQRLTTRSAGR